MIAVAATLGTLSSFRWIESRMPTEFYAHFRIRFRREHAMPEKALRALVNEHGFTVANLNYVLTQDGERFEYRMVLRTLDQSNTPRLAARLGQEESVVEFRIAPTGA
jgi:putative Mg2+ transporter-C (MgtC) family protein